MWKLNDTLTAYIPNNDLAPHIEIVVKINAKAVTPEDAKYVEDFMHRVEQALMITAKAWKDNHPREGGA